MQRMEAIGPAHDEEQGQQQRCRTESSVQVVEQVIQRDRQWRRDQIADREAKTLERFEQLPLCCRGRLPALPVDDGIA